jgi:hypothetical protein
MNLGILRPELIARSLAELVAFHPPGDNPA